MGKNIDIKQELQERVSSLEIAVIMILNSLRRTNEIEVNDVKHKVLGSMSDGELDIIEKLITRPNKIVNK